MKNKYIEALIIGAGQAGISLSYYLQQHQIPHLLLEREVPFSAWRKRWNGFKMNTPNWMNRLPMLNNFPGKDSSGFCTKEEIVEYLDKCLKEVNPPVISNTTVREIIPTKENIWEIYTDDCIYQTPHLAICIGAMNSPRIPSIASSIPPSIVQIHSSQYQNPHQITTKSVLIVGSGSSGMNICKLLSESGKFENIHFSISKQNALPERILGIEIHKFLQLLGFFNLKTNSFLGRMFSTLFNHKSDPIIGVSPKDLKKQYGIHLYGKILRHEKPLFYFSDGKILSAENDLTVIWGTGYNSDYSLIKIDKKDLLDENGKPKHHRGIIEHLPGLYFVGLRNQHTPSSHDIYGVGKDAEYVASHIHNKLLEEREEKCA